MTVHVDGRGVVAEIALKSNASIAPHSNPNLTYFLVIEGGGFVSVGDERARVAAGEAVVWPPDLVHSAWTEQTPMRAIVVEYAPAADAPGLPAIEGPAPRLEATAPRPEDEPADAPVEMPAGAPAQADTATSLRPGVGSGLAGGGRTSPRQVAPPDREASDEPW